jgi:calcineurin-like phosphoesterase family protein
MTQYQVTRAERVVEMHRLILVLLLTLTLAAGWGQDLQLPLKPGSLRFAVIGDSGTGGYGQREIGDRMAEYHARFPFELVLMLGDNIYGRKSARDYVDKFERPYKRLLDQKVKFFAALGNHDNADQRFYKLFNMNGERYYSWKADQGNVRFIALDTNYMDPPQIEWLGRELGGARENWKICFFHHPLYSSGSRHGSDLDLRRVLEPIFLKFGVNVVFAGHDHFYERMNPQKGIHYFVSGAAGKIRPGNILRSELTAKGFDREQHFMLVEVAGDQLHFQAISRKGITVDSGVIIRRNNLSSAPD